MDQELKLWIGGAVLTVVLAVVGTGVAVTTLVVGNVNTQISDVRADMRDVRADMRQIRASVQDVRDSVQGVNDRIDAASGGINAVNTTLLFLTGCIVELEDRQITDRDGARLDAWGDLDLSVRIDLPESCRTAHTRALEAAE